MFPTEDACQEYLSLVRWPEGFRCSHCDSRDAWKMGSGLYCCKQCRRRTSVIAGTIFEGTHKPLQLWFEAIWYVVNQKQGVNALGLQKALGLGSYQTAWEWLHKLRRAMVRPGRDRLHGTVEADETLIGGPQPRRPGRSPEGKILVFVAVEDRGTEGIGRIRLQSIPNARTSTLERAVQEAIEPGSTVRTDGWQGYNTLPSIGYDREITDRKKEDLLPLAHRVASLLKRWLLGTHHGAVRASHIDYYLDEFTFRFNRRKSRSRGKLFYQLMRQAVAVDPVTGTALKAA